MGRVLEDLWHWLADAQPCRVLASAAQRRRVPGAAGPCVQRDRVPNTGANTGAHAGSAHASSHAGPDRGTYSRANACSYSSYPKPYPSTNSSRDADACPYPCAIDTGANGTNATH